MSYLSSSPWTFLFFIRVPKPRAIPIAHNKIAQTPIRKMIPRDVDVILPKGKSS